MPQRNVDRAPGTEIVPQRIKMDEANAFLWEKKSSNSYSSAMKGTFIKKGLSRFNGNPQDAQGTTNNEP